MSARSVCRSLRISSKFKDAEFIGWDMVTSLYGLYEGLFDRIYKVPRVGDSNYTEVINKILEKEKPDGVIVVPEIEVLFWSKHHFPIPHIVPPAAFCELAISKKKVFETLLPYHLVPQCYEVKKSVILDDNYECPIGYPVWIRDSSAGTASGKGSFKAKNLNELQAWANINTDIEEFQLSEYLPGGNYGVFTLFDHGKLIKVALAERIEYIMAKVAVSGITGNTCKGRLLNDERIKSVALNAINIICEKTGTKMHGLCVVDLKAGKDKTPYVTEINIRHVAYSSMFAEAGFNIAESQLLLALNRRDEIPVIIEKTYPINNLMLRDVDGLPIYVNDYRPIKEGDYYGRAPK